MTDKQQAQRIADGVKKQTTFLDPLPRKKHQKLMHVSDAGQGCVEFECHRCGHNTGWLVDDATVTENKRGLPCPNCNNMETAHDN